MIRIMYTVRARKKLLSTAVDTDTNIDTGIHDTTYGCGYGCTDGSNKDMYDS